MLEITREQRKAVNAYIHRIRNSHKRGYAVNCFQVALGNSPTVSADVFELSYMAAQGVRHQIRALIPQCNEINY